MHKIDDLLFSKKLMKQLINEIDSEILIQKGVKEKLSQCTVITASFIQSVGYNNKKITQKDVNGILEAMDINY